MKLHSHIQPAEFLGIQHTQLIMHKIPGHTATIMSQIHYCVITKTEIYYNHPDAFHSPSAVHIALVYLGNSIFWDTMTLARKCPAPPYINLCEPLPGDLTPREACVKSREQR